LTTADLIEILKQKIPVTRRDIPIYADPAEPDRIEEITRAGFNIQPALKPVKKGIDTVKSFILRLFDGDVNILAEIRSYKWKEFREMVLDEPVKFHDHLMDALRYAIYTFIEMGGSNRVPIEEAMGTSDLPDEYDNDLGALLDNDALPDSFF
jgi:phage terminase large subunit